MLIPLLPPTANSPPYILPPPSLLPPLAQSYPQSGTASPNQPPQPTHNNTFHHQASQNVILLAPCSPSQAAQLHSIQPKPPSFRTRPTTTRTRAITALVLASSHTKREVILRRAEHLEPRTKRVCARVRVGLCWVRWPRAG